MRTRLTIQRPSALALCLACLLSSAAVAGTEWRETADSSFRFQVTAQGSVLRGEFGRFDVRLEDFSPSQPGQARLTVTVFLDAADMGDADINSELSGEAWFHVARFSTATFESEQISRREDDTFVATGSLKLKGIRRSVSVPFRWTRQADRARMEGEFSLDRGDFDVGTGDWASGDTVGLQVQLGFNIALEPAT